MSCCISSHSNITVFVPSAVNAKMLWKQHKTGRKWKEIFGTTVLPCKTAMPTLMAIDHLATPHPGSRNAHAAVLHKLPQGEDVVFKEVD
jgi:hypothetical protein